MTGGLPSIYKIITHLSCRVCVFRRSISYNNLSFRVFIVPYYFDGTDITPEYGFLMLITGVVI